MTNYPNYKDKNFNSKIYKKFIDYRIPNSKKDFESICFPNKYKLQIPQEFVSKFINPKTKYHGLLIYHQIGAGKTCAAINTAENFKGKKKIIITVPASLVGNMYKEFLSGCVGDIYTDTKKLRDLDPKSNEYKSMIEKAEKLINKYYKIYSYNKFINLYENKKINLNNTLLIVDEVQNIISDNGTFYKTYYKAINKAKDNKIILLSGTPIFDKPNEIALTLNLLKLPKKLPTGTEFNNKFLKKLDCSDKYNCNYEIKNKKEFQDMITGFVSFFRGAPPVAFPKKKFNLVYCNMSDYQYKSYLTVTDDDDDDGFRTGQILDLPNNFLLGSRIISNIAFPKKKINEEGFNSLKGDYLKLSNLKNYSIKFYFILKKIKKSTGPVFVYSNFKNFGGIMSLARILDNNGYKNFMEAGEGKKRYAIWSGDLSITQKDNIAKMYNQKKNHDGSIIKIILGTPSIKEGVSLLRVSEVHIIEPYWNMALLEQVIGRAVRFCSHKDLSKRKRLVEIYLYIAVYRKDKNTIDNYIWNMAKKKQNIINQFENLLKQNAIDCKLNYHINKLGDKNLNCKL